MAKLSDTYKIKESQTVVNGGGNSAPVSYGGGKLSDRYVIGANTYKAPDVEFKQVPSLSAPSMVSTPSTPIAPTLNTNTEPTEQKSGLLNTIKNWITGGSVPKVSTGVPKTNSMSLAENAYNKATEQKAQQNALNQKLANEQRYGKGNIDLLNRPQYKNPDGSISTVYSMSFNDNGKEILVPTIAFDSNGNPTKLTDQQAIQRYYDTGEYLGKFNTPEEADSYAEWLHKQQEDYYSYPNFVFTGKDGNAVTRDKINLWLQPDYQLTKDEKKQIKELINETTNVANYKKYFGGMDTKDAAKLQQDISRLELRTKGALGYGVAEAIPGVKAAESIAASAIDKVNGNTDVSEKFKADQTATQNTTAYNVGKAASKMGQYIGLNKSGVLNPLTERLGKALIPKLGEKIGGHIANILSDEVADIILDTTPEMVDNILSGKSAKEVASDVVENLKLNLEYNIAGEYLPEAIKTINSKLFKKSVEEVAEDVVIPAIKNGPTEIEKEAEALRKARSVDVLPTIEPTELEKEAQALKNARTAELVPSAIKELEVPTVAKEAETVAKEVAPAVKQTEVPTVAKKATAKKTVQKYTQDEIDDIQSYKNYRDTLLGMAQKHPEFANPVTFDTINRMDDEMWKKYPELFDNGNFKGVPSIADEVSTVAKETSAPKEYKDYDIQIIHRKNGKEAYVPMGKVSDNTSEVIGKPFKTREEAEDFIENYKDNLVMAEDAGLNDEISELIAPVEIKAEAPKIPDGKELPPLEMEDGPVSQFIKGGTTQTVTDPETYKKIYEPIEDLNRHVVKTADYLDMVSDARLLTNGTVDAQKINEWRKALSYAENLTMEDTATAFEIKKFLEDNNMIEEARDFWSRIRPHITNDAQVLNYLSQLKRNSIEGSVEQAFANVRRAVDKNKGKGFSDAVDNFARQVEDTITSGNTKNVSGMFKKKLSDYAYGSTAKNRLKNKSIDGEQMVLDLIGGWEPDKKTPKELAEEVGSLIRKMNGVADITTKDEANIYKLLEEASNYETSTRQFKELQAKAAKIIDSKIPTSVLDKVKTTLYDNMLGNFKTAVTRNAGGNLISNALEKSQKPLKVAIDKLVSKITGERNYLLSSDVAKSYGEGFKKGLKDQALDFKTRINTTRSGEEAFADALANVKTAYKGSNVVSKALGEYDRIVKSAMQFGDRPFYEAEFNAAKTELNKIVNKFGKDALSKLVPDEALGDIDATIEFLARERALEACFQKGTISAEGFKQLKEGLGNVSKGVVGADVISQFSMPFIQVPANMMERMADYIPGLGTVKNLATTLAESKFGNGFNQRRFVDATSRNLTGLGLFAGGVALANNAANGGAGITDGYSDDYDKAAVEKAAGEQEYAIQLPNGYQIDISDLPVLGPTAQASARFAEALRNNKGDIGEGIAEGSGQALSSAFETSALQGLNRMFGTSQYGAGGLGENVKSVLGSGLGQAVPSLIRQSAQVADPYKRDLGEYGTLQYYLNNLINSTPARMSALNPKLDNEGNIIEQNQGRSTGMKVLENMILPWTISKPEYSKLGEAANEIYENSSDHTTKAYPTVPSRSKAKEWLGDRYDDQAYYDLKEMAGRYNTRIGGYIVGTRFFKDLSPDDQADVMSSINTAITALVRERAERGYENKNTLAKKYKEGGLDAIMEYLKNKYSKEIPTLK